MPQALFFETNLSKTLRLPYLLYLQAGYPGAETERWPFIFFLHGAGERGAAPDLVRTVGLPPVIEAWPDCPFIVAAPQCPAHSDWVLELDALEALLDDLVSTYRIDPARIYLTGMSMGGRGAWQLASRNPGRFAAIAPVCGRRPVGLYGPDDLLLKGLPAWLFHGARDEIIPLEETEFMAALLQSAGTEVRLKIYPDAGHDSWTEAYRTPELYEWLLGHSR